VSTTLTVTCRVLIWVAPIVLLVVRFIRPQRISWTAIVLIVALLSYLLVPAEIHLRPGVVLDQVEECRALAAKAPPPGPDCPIPLVDYWTWPFYLMWVPGIAALLVWLPVYGAVFLLRRRLRGSAT
jgi:hypothetical protein